MPRCDGGMATALVPVAAGLRAVAGLPSWGSIFVFHTMADILRRVHGRLGTQGFNRADQAMPDQPALLYCDVPDRAAAAALAAMGADCFVVRESFAHAVRYSMAARGMSHIEAARFVSQSVAAIDGLERVCTPRAIEVAPNWPIARWIDHLAAVVGVHPARWAAVRPAMLDAYAGHVTVAAAIRAIVQHADACFGEAAALVPDAQAVIAALAAGYDRAGQEVLEWPADMLLGAAAPYRPVAGPIDLVGPARVLTFGPYLHLPAGRWAATYRFETWGNESTNALGFDVVADGEVKFSTQGIVDTAGQFGVECAFAVADPLQPVEFRCFLAEGAIGGVLRPCGVSLRRLDPGMRKE